MRGGEVRKYFNPKWYTPLGTLKDKVEREDAKRWADKPGYQEQMGAKAIESGIDSQTKEAFRGKK